MVIILVSSFFELILPEGKVKPFVRLAIGLFILISILNPTLNYLYSNKDLHINLWEYKEELISSEEILDSGNKINKQIMNQSDQVIRQKFEGQISAIAMLVPGVEGVETKADLLENGDVSSLYILVRPEILEIEDDQDRVGVFSLSGRHNEAEQRAIREKIINIVKNMYSLENIDIQVEFEGG